MLEDMPPDTVMLLPGASETMMGHDIPYPFRQHPDFLWLTGFSEPDALAVLREELQAETKAEAPAEPAAPPKPATTVPIKDRPFMRGTTSSGLASGA